MGGPHARSKSLVGQRRTARCNCWKRHLARAKFSRTAQVITRAYCARSGQQTMQMRRGSLAKSYVRLRNVRQNLSVAETTVGAKPLANAVIARPNRLIKATREQARSHCFNLHRNAGVEKTKPRFHRCIATIARSISPADAHAVRDAHGARGAPAPRVAAAPRSV
jgi:hypothetical protein